MSGAGWPDAVPFEPSEATRAELRATLLGTGADAPPLLLAIEGSSPAGWWRRAAIGIADGLSAPDHRVLLLDLHVPSELGRILGAVAGDGLTDVLFFGASLEHALQRPVGHSFDVLPPGTAADDAARLAGAAGWRALLRRLSAGGRQVVIAAPAGALAGADWTATVRTVRLGRAEGDAGDARPDVHLVPPGGTRADEREAARAARGGERRAFVAGRLGGGAAGAPATAGVAAEDAPPQDPVVTRAPRPPVRHRSLAWTIAVVLLVSALAGVWHFLLRDRTGGVADGAVDRAAPPPAAPAADGAGPVALAYSVAIEAHPDLSTARSRLASLHAADSATQYFISPTLVDSVLYYHVMAGPVRDSAQAAWIAQRLITSGQKTAASARDIRRAPLSFLIDEFATREAAEQAQARLATLGIPAFVLFSPTRTEAPFRLHTGAYAGLAEADVMAQMLRSAGLPDSLVTLTGGSP